MKKLFTICFLLMLLVGKSNAQTQFPFYGFELSNYEVGDTLEYYSTYYSPPGSFPSDIDTDIYRIINKEVISSDTIKYLIQDSYSHAYGPFYNTMKGKDTILRIITNDLIYNNDNNMLRQLLPGIDTSHQGNDIEYDTITGAKMLWVNGTIAPPNNNYGGYYYNAVQNLGLTVFNKYEVIVPPFYLDSLIYAHLAHYGIYGKLSPVILGINNLSHTFSSISICYDNNMNTWLNISSNQNLSNPILSIYDLLSRNVKTQQVNTGSNLIDMQALPKGIYLYKVESNGNVLGQGKLMNMTN